MHIIRGRCCDLVPFFTSSSRSPLHSERKMLAPVRLPSPPQTHRLEMPRFTRLKAAAKRPSRVVKALQRALPITVPPCGGQDQCGCCYVCRHCICASFRGIFCNASTQAKCMSALCLNSRKHASQPQKKRGKSLSTTA